VLINGLGRFINIGRYNLCMNKKILKKKRKFFNILTKQSINWFRIFAVPIVAVALCSGCAGPKQMIPKEKLIEENDKNLDEYSRKRIEMGRLIYSPYREEREKGLETIKRELGEKIRSMNKIKTGKECDGGVGLEIMKFWVMTKFKNHLLEVSDSIATETANDIIKIWKEQGMFEFYKRLENQDIYKRIKMKEKKKKYKGNEFEEIKDIGSDSKSLG